MAARGCLFGVLGVVAGLALLGELADVGARHLATSKVEQRISQAVPRANGVHVRIRSFPFLKVAVDGRIDEIDARVSRIEVSPVAYTDVAVELRGVQVSVSDMVTDARIDVTHIDRGTVSVTLTEPALFRALAGVPAGGSVLGPVGSVLERAALSVDARTRQLMVAIPGVAGVGLPLPGSAILPCTPALTRGPAEVTLSCTFHNVPAAFTSISSS